MTKPIVTEFNLVDMLPKIREAFDNKSLQMFTADKLDACLYSGPCAIGVCLSEEMRDYYDNIGLKPFTNDDGGEMWLCVSADDLVGEGVFSAPEDQRNDLVNLQHTHDMALGEGDDSRLHDAFRDLLSELEQKYLK